MRLLPFVCALLFSLWSGGARAHPLAPASLAVHETQVGQAQATFKYSLQVRSQALSPGFPAECSAGLIGVSTQQGSRTARYSMRCPGRSLQGLRLGVDGLQDASINALVRVQLADGRVVRSLLSEGRPWFVIPPRSSALEVAGDYLLLGVEHLLTGLDHVLFVVALLWLVSGLRRVLWTLTAFTAGHSVTLCLAALGLVNVPQAPVEVAIAATLVLAALHVVHPPEGGLRMGWALAAGFGLVHGLGFAGALSETGLPTDEVPLSLASFNLGIELGQVLVVLIWWLAGALARQRFEVVPRWWRAGCGYAVGSLAAMWCMERALNAPW